MISIKAPSVGESITEVRVGAWKRKSGDVVKAGEVLLEIESDKATVEVVADAAGRLDQVHATGDTVKIGEVLGTITNAGATEPVKKVDSTPAEPPSTPKGNGGAGPATAGPAARKAAADMGVSLSAVPGTGKDGRVTKGDLLNQTQPPSQPKTELKPQTETGTASEKLDKTTRTRRVPMSMLRTRIAERLVSAQHTAAILTTFNECDMGAVMALRARHKATFQAKHGVALSFMSFFTRAVVEALKTIPAVNARIDGKDIVYHDYYDIGIAVGTEKGLVVPVLRDAGSMGFVAIEKGIAALAAKARDGKLSIPDLSGGTFTISNGGTYGSLLSTPILNPPQSGILGMHKIQERAVVVDGQVVARPMMYLALSYDHRLIDGKEAVTFLIKVKEGIEKPESLGFEG